MPTENRSSNTEMVSELLPCPFCKAAMRIESNRDWHRLMGDHDEECAFSDPETMTVPATDEQRAIMVNDWNRRAQPAEQRQGEPVAHQFQDRDGKWHDFQNQRHYECTVADGTWPIRALFTHADPGEVKRLREENRVLQKQLGERWTDIDALNKSNEEYSAAAVDSGMQNDTLRAQLAERDALLREAIEFIDDGVGRSDAEWRLIKKLRAAISPGEGASATDEPYQGIPGTSFQRLNALANQGE